MKLRECLKSSVNNFMVVDSSGQLLFCGINTDPDNFIKLRLYLDKGVVSTAYSGTYLILTLEVNHNEDESLSFPSDGSSITFSIMPHHNIS